jgi:hypothetical protein
MRTFALLAACATVVAASAPTAASKPAAKARTKPAHDHAKFHKNQ